MANFQGALDEVAAYNTALSPAEIERHYTTSQVVWGNYSNVVLSDHPVGYWQLSDHGGQAADVSGHNNNGTYTGNAVFRLQGVLSTNVFNQFSIFLREFPLDPVTQLDLDDSGIAGTNQAQLGALGYQPNYGPADFLPREQKDIDILTQADLDLQIQGQLERIRDTMTEDWIEIRFQWSAYTSTLTVTNRPEDLVYEFTDINVIPGQDYILIPTLEETSLRVRIYLLDERGQIRWDRQILDTTEINDPSLIRRRRGRVGTNLQLIDGDANIQNFRARWLSYGEVYSTKFESITPVTGASLFATYTPDRELFQGWDPGPWGGLVDVDTSKSNSGNAFKVTNLGKKALQGIQSTQMYIDDWAAIEILFDLWVPQSVSDTYQLTAFLLGEQSRIISLNLGQFIPEHWQSFKLQLDGQQWYQTGPYRFVLLQSMVTDPLSWFIDNISISQKAVTWYARSRDDYWYGRWQEFGDTVNSVGGMLFPHEGTSLQYRGQALRHNAQINELRTQPRYSEPGRFVWSDEDIVFRAPPVAAFNSKIDYNVAVLSGYPSRDGGNGRIISWDWTFGDGTIDSGPVVQHNYQIDGTYTVTLTITDDEGNQAQTTGTVTSSHTFETSAFWRASSNWQAIPWLTGQTVEGQAPTWTGTGSMTANGGTTNIVFGGLHWAGTSRLTMDATLQIPPSSTPTLAGRGTFIWQVDANYVNTNIARMNYVMIKGQDGTSRFNAGTINTWVLEAKSHGYRVAIWGYIYGNDPVGEANLAADLVTQYGVDAYVADAESEYESNPNPVSTQFCNQFRARLPNFEAGLSSFGRPSLHGGLNWSTWAAHNFIGLPQAYFNDSNLLDVPDCVNDWHNHGFSLVYPTVPCYSGALGRPSSQAIANSVRGQPGWSTWSVDTMILSDFQALGGV